ncbi:MAG: hypothetical protein FWG73_09830 [Planctomycetaceae bacterium]|nr:hypothetical protein [Planctomycetaceae bacterium]
MERTNFGTLPVADRSALPPFGLPPRTVSDKVQRSLCYPVILLVVNGIFLVLTTAIVAIFWISDDSEIRYSSLPFRWVPTGEGRIVAIVDSSTELAPSGKPAPPGLDIITLEQTLPDGRTIRSRHPDRPNAGRFHVGQIVPLLHYVSDPNCLAIDDPRGWFDVYMPFGMGTFFLTIVVAFHVSPFFIALRQRDVQLLESAPIKRFQVERPKNNKKALFLLPLDDALPSIGRNLAVQSGSGLRHGQTVHVFYNEACPRESFIVEASWSPLIFDSATGHIDCRSDWPFRLGLAMHVLFFLILSAALLRVLLIY